MDSLNSLFEKADREFGRFNLAVFGKTGVGKSTLINAIFGEDVALTGNVQPVTNESKLYVHKSGRLGLIDTKGLEIGQDSKVIIRDLRAYVHSMRTVKDSSEHLHLVWYCVRATDRRFEPVEEEFIRELAKLDVPVMLVLTQVARRGDQFSPDTVELIEHLRSLNLPIAGEPIPVCARADGFDGSVVHGLLGLLDATFQRAPSSVGRAITAAQKIDAKRKIDLANKIIVGATVAAAAAGASPIPFSDAAILVPIQVSMLAGISMTFDMPIDSSVLLTLAGVAAATAAGRTVASNLLKLIPFAGSVVGGTISAAVASAVTGAMGEAWIAVCKKFDAGDLRALDGTLNQFQIKELFSEQLKQAWLRRGNA